MKIKHIFYLILLLSSSLIYVLLICIGIDKRDIDLDEYRRYEGLVDYTGITMQKRSRGRIASVFYVSLEGLEKDLGIEKSTERCVELKKKIKSGDILIVYFKDHTHFKEDINTTLVQIERKGEIILDKKESESGMTFLIFAGVAGLIITLFITYKSFKYYRKQFLDEEYIDFQD